MRLVLNENKILANALEKGEIENKPTVTLLVLAKHYFNIGQSKEQVFSSIDNFMSNNYKEYVFAKWQNHIKRIVNSTYKKKSYDLLQIDSVIVYKNELETIESIGDPKLEKLAFVLLVYAKLFNKIYGKERNWVNASIKEIAEDTAMKINEVECALLINMLYRIGLVYPSKIVDSTDVKILFVDERGDAGIEIRDFDNIVLYYQKYVGDKIGNCEVCGKLIELTAINKKYCKACRKEKQLQWQRESWHKNKSKYDY